MRQSAGFIFKPTQRFCHKGQRRDINSILTRDKGPCCLHFECHGGEQEDNIYMAFDVNPVHFQEVLTRFSFYCVSGVVIRGRKEAWSTSDDSIPFM